MYFKMQAQLETKQLNFYENWLQMKWGKKKNSPVKIKL